jgi:hypothetical protein
MRIGRMDPLPTGDRRQQGYRHTTEENVRSAWSGWCGQTEYGKERRCEKSVSSQRAPCGRTAQTEWQERRRGAKGEEVSKGTTCRGRGNCRIRLVPSFPSHHRRAFFTCPYACCCPLFSLGGRVDCAQSCLANPLTFALHHWKSFLQVAVPSTRYQSCSTLTSKPYKVRLRIREQKASPVYHLPTLPRKSLRVSHKTVRFGHYARQAQSWICDLDQLRFLRQSLVYYHGNISP